MITAAELVQADGFLFGLPSRYGSAPAQVKSFWDSTGQLWYAGALSGKYAGIFSCSGGQQYTLSPLDFMHSGGQESVAFSFLPNLVHHGIIYVPLGYSNPILHNMTEIVGGSPWGAGTFSGADGSRQVSDLEKQLGEHQGKQFATTLAKAHSGLTN